ncbi:hypothetical protein J6590_023523 [Homalodisca vitripennis]|nr:hypothetical protein J6590_023523 [Homalodisca vitripennis]
MSSRQKSSRQQSTKRLQTWNTELAEASSGTLPTASLQLTVYYKRVSQLGYQHRMSSRQKSSRQQSTKRLQTWNTELAEASSGTLPTASLQLTVYYKRVSQLGYQHRCVYYTHLTASQDELTAEI